MAMRFKQGDKFAGYKVKRIHLSDDGLERYEVRREDGLTRALLHCPAVEEKDRGPRGLDIEALTLRLTAIDDSELPAVLEARQTDGFSWIACEYPPKGRKLSTALEDGRFESIADALVLVGSIAALLERASQRGFVHGRIHPGLIWIDDRKRLVKVYDLGFSDIFGPMPLSCPQRYCLAPEQLKGAPASGRSDIYAMGVILYELISGHPIFTTEENAPSREKMIDLILTREPPALAQIRGIPAYIDDFVFHAMAKREDDRFPTWEAFRSALQDVTARYLREEPGSGPVRVLPPDSSEPSDPDRVQRDTLESLDSSAGGSGLVADAGDLPPPSPPEAPHREPVELPPASPAVVPRPEAPAAELPAAPELPAPAPVEVPMPPAPKIPANDREPPARDWRHKRKPKEPLAAITLLALLLCVLLSFAAYKNFSTAGLSQASSPSASASASPSASASAPAVVSAFIPVSIQPAAPGSIASDKARARALVVQAADAMMADEWAKAEALLRAAWQLDKTYDTAGNLGHVELKNGKPRQAAEHLRFCLNAFPPSEPITQRDRVQGRFDEARRLIAALDIMVNVPGAEVSIDGEPVGVSPIPAEVFVDPGDRVVTAKLPGYDVAHVVVTTVKGGSHKVTLLLERAAGAPGIEVPVLASGRPSPTASPSPEVPVYASGTAPAASAVPSSSLAVRAPLRASAGAPAAPSSSAPVLPPEVAELRELYQYATPEGGR